MKLLFAVASLSLALLPSGQEIASIRDEASVELVESAPIETTLDHPDIRNAGEVWLEMIQASKQRLDFAEFYASDEEGGGRLEPIVVAIERAAGRGVHVRFLA